MRTFCADPHADSCMTCACSLIDGLIDLFAQIGIKSASERRGEEGQIYIYIYIYVYIYISISLSLYMLIFSNICIRIIGAQLYCCTAVVLLSCICMIPT